MVTSQGYRALIRGWTGGGNADWRLFMGCEKKATAVAGGFSGVVLFNLLDNETVVASVVGDNDWEERVLTGPDFEQLGPGIDDLTVHYEGGNRQGNFEWRIVMQRRLSQGWVPTTFAATDEVVSEVTTDGYTIAPPYNERAALGVNVRLVLQYHSKTGGSVGDRQTLTIGAAARPWAK